jgi:hypothetical protein
MPDTRSKRLARAVQERSLPTLFAMIQESFASIRKSAPYQIQEGIEQHLLSFFEAIRVQRNDAVHPTIGKVSGDAVRMSAAFPQACRSVMSLRDWLNSSSV